MSKYGEIQPVNKYSSNPFWTPDSPYNLRFPSPIYATGPDLNTETCNNTVAALVNSYCSANNNCSKLQVSDVRPKIMVQLSQLPGHNYATSCGGYIDNTVKEYKKNHGNSFSGINVVQQPKTTKPLSLTGVVTSQPKTKSDGVAERTAELEQVQAMTTQTIDVVETDFPKTIADLSFVDRVANATAGYEPYKDLKSYHIPKFETEQEYYSRMESVLKHNINYETYNGKPKSKSPTSYLTGRGAKITWHPTREYSTFKGWCENEDLTLNPDDCPANCPMEPSIDPMSKSDKSFYACWECDADHTMIRDHYCECPDKKHMNEKCECLPKNITKLDGDKCVCNDTTLDIDSGCKCPAGSHMTQDPTTGMCACRNPYENDPSNPSVCKCKDPNGDPNNGCNVPPPEPCPDPNADHKDPNASCACYPSDFMGSDCGCWGISTWNDTSKKCVCPITDTSNLAIPELATVTGACTCPSTKPNFNPTAKRCEEDASTPSDDGETYAVLQCRVSNDDKIANIHSLPASTDPARSLNCKGTDPDIDKCFTPCQSKDATASPIMSLSHSDGFINSKIKSSLGKDFCAGNRYHYYDYGTNSMPYAVHFFSQDDLDARATTKNTPIEFTNLEIDKIKTIITSNQNNEKCKTRGSRWWMVYILKKTSDNKWQAVDEIVLYHR